jgi:hypothetical protein
MGSKTTTKRGVQGTQAVNWVDRPYPAGADAKSKFTAEDEYELVYMRHRYLRRSPNPEPARMAMFEKTARIIARKAAHWGDYVFGVNGQDEQDLLNVARVHVVSYLGQFGLREHPEKLEKFRADFAKKKEKALKKKGLPFTQRDLQPTEAEIDKKDSDSCASFLWQRLEEWGKIASGKNKNIRGTYSTTAYFRAPAGIDDSRVTDQMLLDSAEVFGFARVFKKDFEEARVALGLKKPTRVEHGGFVLRKAYAPPTDLAQDDVGEGLYGDDRSAYYATPLDNIANVQSVGDAEFFLTDHLSEPGKLRMMKAYVDQNKNKQDLRGDVDAAVDFIRRYEPSYDPGFEEYGQGAYCRWPRR